MVAALSRPLASASTPDEQRILLHGVSWKDYVILRDVLDGPSPRMTYVEGALELMSPSPSHGRWKSNIARMLELYAFHAGIDLRAYGSTTLKRGPDARAAEPDECYLIGKSLDEYPQMVLEVVHTTPLLDKRTVYAAMGVAELWVYERGGSPSSASTRRRRGTSSGRGAPSSPRSTSPCSPATCRGRTRSPLYASSRPRCSRSPSVHRRSVSQRARARALEAREASLAAAVVVLSRPVAPLPPSEAMLSSEWKVASHYLLRLSSSRARPAARRALPTTDDALLSWAETVLAENRALMARSIAPSPPGVAPLSRFLGLLSPSRGNRAYPALLGASSDGEMAANARQMSRSIGQNATAVVRTATTRWPLSREARLQATGERQAPPVESLMARSNADAGDKGAIAGATTANAPGAAGYWYGMGAVDQIPPLATHPACVDWGAVVESMV